MLAAELASSPQLRTVDSLRVFRTLAARELHGETLAAPGQLANVADLLEADCLLTGRIRSLEGGLELQVRLIAPALPGDATVIDAVAPGAGDLPAAVRTLAEAVRRALAVPAGGAPP